MKYIRMSNNQYSQFVCTHTCHEHRNANVPLDYRQKMNKAKFHIPYEHKIKCAVSPVTLETKDGNTTKQTPHITRKDPVHKPTEANPRQ
jgi:hypothetical protein